MRRYRLFGVAYKAGLENETEETRNERRILAWPRPDRRSGSSSSLTLTFDGRKYALDKIVAGHDQVFGYLHVLPFVDRTKASCNTSILQYELRKPNLTHEASSALPMSSSPALKCIITWYMFER